MKIIFVFFAILIAFLWGLQPLIHKHLLVKYHWASLIVITSFIFFIMSLILTAFHWNIFLKDIEKIQFNDAATFAFLAIITSFLTSIVYYIVLKGNETPLVVALIYSAPAFTLLLSYFLLKEKINTLSLVGCLLILSGIICIAL